MTSKKRKRRACMQGHCLTVIRGRQLPARAGAQIWWCMRLMVQFFAPLPRRGATSRARRLRRLLRHGPPPVSRRLGVSALLPWLVLLLVPRRPRAPPPPRCRAVGGLLSFLSFLRLLRPCRCRHLPLPRRLPASPLPCRVWHWRRPSSSAIARRDVGLPRGGGLRRRAALPVGYVGMSSSYMGLIARPACWCVALSTVGYRKRLDTTYLPPVAASDRWLCGGAPSGPLGSRGRA